MKAALILCIIALAGVLGYLAEPSLRPAVTGRSTGEAAPVTSEVIVIESPDINPHDFAPEQLPKTLKVTYPTRFVAQASGLTINMEVGSIVKLIRLEGKAVIVSPGETGLKAPMPISSTDLLEQLIGVTPIPLAERKPAEPQLTTSPGEAATSDGDGEVIADNSGESSEPATGEDEPADAPEVAETETPAEDPAEEKPEEHLPPPAKGDVVAIMKNAIMEGQLKEFTFAQVTNWTAGDNETVDGKEFATGMVTYTTETLFGKKTIEAKAYLSGKKVVRWIWPKSGIELE